MDKKIVLIAFIGLITVNQSCTNKTGGQQPQSTDFDSVAADSTAELDSLSPYWYDKNQTEVIFSDKKDTLYRFPIPQGSSRKMRRTSLPFQTSAAAL
jgi:hypothetical protein